VIVPPVRFHHAHGHKSIVESAEHHGDAHPIEDLAVNEVRNEVVHLRQIHTFVIFPGRGQDHLHSPYDCDDRAGDLKEQV
jgi:hypothetical protein